MLYDKANEGATYEDGTSGNDTADNSVMPNETFVYTWSVPEEVGPAESDPQCLTWLYQSSVDPVKDKHSGESFEVRIHDVVTILLLSCTYGEYYLAARRYEISLRNFSSL